MDQEEIIDYENIEEVNYIRRNLQEIPDLSKFKNIKKLDVSSNIINIVNNLPSTLIEFECYENQIIELDYLPQGLKKLSCQNNKITSLDNLPQGLEYLNCAYNQITSLNNLPQGLKELYCDVNKITSLDNLPTGLINLSCSDNLLTSLNNLPLGLIELECHNNKFTELNNLPDSINTIILYDYNNIVKIKHLPLNLKYIETDGGFNEDLLALWNKFFTDNEDPENNYFEPTREQIENYNNYMLSLE